MQTQRCVMTKPMFSSNNIEEYHDLNGGACLGEHAGTFGIEHRIDIVIYRLQKLSPLAGVENALDF